MEPDDDKTLLPSNLKGAPEAKVDHFARASTHVLPKGTRLGEFEIVNLIGEGGFGIVYLAFDHSLERHVAVKEYMPSGLVARTRDMHVTVTSPAHADTFNTGLRSFINEARLLARFDSPALVKVFRFWEANGTAYMAMPFYEGVTVKEAFTSGSIVPNEPWIKAFLAHLFDAVETIHAAQCYHRDIAPDNILLLRDGRPLLLDFGAARRVITDRTQGPTAILKPGFAPIEQYADIPNLKQGPWTDVYALGALVYYLMTGKAPSPAVSRIMHDDVVPASTAGKGRFSASFLAGLDRAMAVRPEQRIQNIPELRSALGIYQDLPRTMPPAQPWAGEKTAPPGHFSNIDEYGKTTEPTRLKPEPRTLPGDTATEPPLTLRRTWTAPPGRRPKLVWGAALAILVLAGAVAGIVLRSEAPELKLGRDGSSNMPTSQPAPPVPDPTPGASPPVLLPAPKAETFPNTSEKSEPVRTASREEKPAEPTSRPTPVPAPGPSASPDDAMWEMVSVLDNVEGYRAYLSQFSKGRHTAEARARIAQLASSPKPDKPPISVDPPKVPEPPREKPANKPAPSVEEENLWRAVRNIDQPLAYESFLNRYPNDFYAPDARRRLAELNKLVAKTTPKDGPSGKLPAVPANPGPPVSPPDDRAGPIAPQPGLPADKPGPVKPQPPVQPQQGQQAQQPQPQPEAQPPSRPRPIEPEPDPEPAPGSRPPIVLSDQTLTGNFQMDPVTGHISGQGRILYKNRDQFIGTLVRGMKEGSGEFIWASGQRYKGEWQRNQPNGKGHMKFPNGNEYTGDMKDGIPEGIGTMLFSNGNRYTGSVKNGLPDGQGTNRFPNGDVLSGAWSRGKSHGHGRYTWANGSYWEGEYKDDKQTENGKTVYATGGERAGVTDTARKGEAD